MALEHQRFRRRGSTLALLASLCLFREAGAQDDEGPRLPGPAPQPRGYALLDKSEECAECHPAIAAEWRASYHKSAFSDPAYQRALHREPTAFCRRCHAPEAPPAAPPGKAAASHGVTCVTCHMPERGDEVVTGITHKDKDHTQAGAATSPLVHRLRRDPRWSSDDACLRCHEFQFPDGRNRRRPEYMQLTIREHRDSRFASESCVDCHMPKQADGHRSHRFLSAHDEATLRAALHTTASVKDGRFLLRLEPAHVGHAFPTGDLFRRLVVDVQATDARQATIYSARRELMRRFESEEQRPGTRVRVCAADSRLFGVTALQFPIAASAQAVQYKVRYQRVAFPLDHRGGPAIIDGEVELAAGVVPAR